MQEDSSQNLCISENDTVHKLIEIACSDEFSTIITAQSFPSQMDVS